MKKMLIAAILTTLVLGLIGSAQAGGPGWGRGMGRGMGYGAHGPEYGIGPALNPTPEQLSQWADLQGKHMSEILPLRSQLFAKKMELSGLMAQPDADIQTIQEKQGEVLALYTQIKEKTMTHQLAFRQSLTPEQISMWGTAPPRCPHGDRKGMGMGPGMGCGMGVCPGMGRDMRMDPGMDHGPGRGYGCCMGHPCRAW